jgi:DnaJ-class molecular chaperone
MNPYEVLGVSKGASQDEIKRAYKKKAIECHPDKTNGDKSKEDEFKQINEAYSILSDAQKKQEYDMFGSVGGGAGTAGPGAGGFDPFAEMFGSMFNFGAGGAGPARQQKRTDVITITLSVSDMFNGATKKVEFEMIDKCKTCDGCGAHDPASIVKCMSCHGSGQLRQQMGPFLTMSTCPSCSGQGKMRTGKACAVCKGSKTQYRKRAFELKLPKGINPGAEMRMEDKGAFNPESGGHNDILFRFNYDVPANYKIDTQSGNVTYTHSITVDDLLGGFEHKVKIYDEYEITLASDHYFNPDSKRVVIPDKGMYVPVRDRSGDLIITFQVKWTDGEKIVKYREIFQKIYKRQPSATKSNSAPSPNTFYATSENSEAS